VRQDRPDPPIRSVIPQGENVDSSASKAFRRASAHSSESYFRSDSAPSLA
jgi:hypothetical protein